MGPPPIRRATTDTRTCQRLPDGADDQPVNARRRADHAPVLLQPATMAEVELIAMDVCHCRTCLGGDHRSGGVVPDAFNIPLLRWKAQVCVGLSPRNHGILGLAVQTHQVAGLSDVLENAISVVHV